MSDEKVVTETKEAPQTAKDKNGRVIELGDEVVLRFRVSKIENKRPRGQKPIVHLESIDEHGPSRTKTGIWLHDDELVGE